MELEQGVPPEPVAVDEGLAGRTVLVTGGSRGLAAEVGPSGVRVVNVLPGFIRTGGAIAHHRKIAESRGVSLEEAQRDLAASLNVLLAEPGTPEDAAELIVFLASQRGRWLTGAQYRVDGGILPMV